MDINALSLYQTRAKVSFTWFKCTKQIGYLNIYTFIVTLHVGQITVKSLLGIIKHSEIAQ